MTVVASYSYDSSKRELVSYDTPQIATAKAQYVLSKGLGGQMFWEVSLTRVPDLMSKLTKNGARTLSSSLPIRRALQIPSSAPQPTSSADLIRHRTTSSTSFLLTFRVRCMISSAQLPEQQMGQHS